ncbi:STM3941 family protein [Kitasatospora sp. NPDC048407]|uniref:STM3941 family protein n=1 Tax=Kitasatospora sp. NPDC048407 TaxID=3364051 RepID=UPI00371AF0AC
MINDVPAVLPPTVHRLPPARRTLVLCALFVAAGLVLVVSGESVTAGVVSILFFGLGGAAMLAVRIQWGPELVLDADGLEGRQLGRIHWAEIRTARCRVAGNKWMVELTGHPGALFPPRPSKFGAWVTRANRKAEFGTVQIHQDVLPVNVAEVLGQMLLYHPDLTALPLAERTIETALRTRVAKPRNRPEKDRPEPMPPTPPPPAEPAEPAEPADVDRLVAAFPPQLADDVRAALVVLPPAGHLTSHGFTVQVSGRPVAIPVRIYHDEPSAEAVNALTPRQRQLLHCLYTRHHDGRIRQRHLERIVGSTDPWVAPFVLQLAGEYVLVILRLIHDHLTELAAPGTEGRRVYGRFVADNPAYFALTGQRVLSYWNAYHRDAYPDFRTYPGSALLDLLRAAADDAADDDEPPRVNRVHQ